MNIDELAEDIKQTLMVFYSSVDWQNNSHFKGSELTVSINRGTNGSLTAKYIMYAETHK